MNPIRLEANQLEALEGAFTSLLNSVRAETHIPGLSIALSINGQRIIVNSGSMAVGSGISMSSQAQFQIGCITKLLTCMIAAELIVNGDLDRDADITHYLPELGEAANACSIKVWHLMSHTSGYRGLDINDPSVAYYYSWEKFLDFFRKKEQLFEPGSVFSYEHSEHVVLGKIIETVSGCSIAGLMKKRIFEFLGIRPGSITSDRKISELFVVDHRVNPTTHAYEKIASIPFGQFWQPSLSEITMRLSDLVRIGEQIIGVSPDGSGASVPLNEAMEFVQKQVVKLPETYGSSRPEQLPAAFGVGCAAYRGWLLGHNGSARGQTCGLRFDPRNKIVLAIGINSWQPFLRDHLINHIFSTLRGAELPPAERIPLEFTFQELAGTYIGIHGKDITVSIKDSFLICQINGATKNQSIQITLTRDERGQLCVVGDAQHHSLGFFLDPDDGGLCLFFGLISYRKRLS